MPFTADTEAWVNQYVAVWNDPDAASRRRAIAEIWAEDGVEFISEGEYAGPAALEARITEAYEKFVRGAGFVFTAGKVVVQHHDAITFTTFMVPATGGDPAWTGVVFALVDPSGRIRRDYQFTTG